MCCYWKKHSYKHLLPTFPVGSSLLMCLLIECLISVNKDHLQLQFSCIFCMCFSLKFYPYISLQWMLHQAGTSIDSQCPIAWWTYRLGDSTGARRSDHIHLLRNGNEWVEPFHSRFLSLFVEIAVCGFTSSVSILSNFLMSCAQSEKKSMISTYK